MSQLETSINDILTRGVISYHNFLIAIQDEDQIIVPRKSEYGLSYYRYRIDTGKEIKLHIAIDPKYHKFQTEDLWYSVDGWYGSNEFKFNSPNRVMFKTARKFNGITYNPVTLRDKFIVYHPVKGEVPPNVLVKPRMCLKLNLYRRTSKVTTHKLVHGIKYLAGPVNIENHDTFEPLTTANLNLEFFTTQEDSLRVNFNNLYLLVKSLECNRRMLATSTQIQTITKSLEDLRRNLDQTQVEKFQILATREQLQRVIADQLELDVFQEPIPITDRPPVSTESGDDVETSLVSDTTSEPSASV